MRGDDSDIVLVKLCKRRTVASRPATALHRPVTYTPHRRALFGAIRLRETHGAATVA